MFVLGMGLVSTLFLIRLRGLWPLAPLSLLAASAWSGVRYTLGVQGLYLSPLMPLVTLGGNFGLLIFLKFWSEEREKRKIRSSFEHYLSPYRKKRFKEAVGFFEQALALKPEDNPSMVYIKRCEMMQDFPLPPDWDGVWTMNSK